MVSATSDEFEYLKHQAADALDRHAQTRQRSTNGLDLPTIWKAVGFAGGFTIFDTVRSLNLRIERRTEQEINGIIEILAAYFFK